MSTDEYMFSVASEAWSCRPLRSVTSNEAQCMILSTLNVQLIRSGSAK